MLSAVSVDWLKFKSYFAVAHNLQLIFVGVYKVTHTVCEVPIIFDFVICKVCKMVHGSLLFALNYMFVW